MIHTLNLLSVQFQRSFPGPPGITPEEVCALAERYKDRNNHGRCNYFKFHEDVTNIGDTESESNRVRHTKREEVQLYSYIGSPAESVITSLVHMQ